MLTDSDQSIVDIDPQAVCGYDPCKVVKCFGSPYARCLSDFRCKAIFFDSEERKLDFCKGKCIAFLLEILTFCALRHNNYLLVQNHYYFIRLEIKLI